MHPTVIATAVLLVCVGLTTAVAEDTPEAQLTKNGEVEIAKDRVPHHQLSKRNDRNNWDRPHFIQCSNGYGLYRVQSAHDNGGKEDVGWISVADTLPLQPPATGLAILTILTNPFPSCVLQITT